MIRILLVDDQNLVQQGIKSLLEQDMELKVIGTVKDGRSAVQQIAQTNPDIVLLDIEMPGMNGITTTKHIKRIAPETKVIILSSHEDKKYVTQALMAGARGYILKSSLMTDLKQAILAVCNGYSQIDSRLLAKVFDPQNIRIRKANTPSPSEKKAPVFKGVTREKSTIQSDNYVPSSVPEIDRDDLDSNQGETENSLNLDLDSSAISSETSESETVLPASSDINSQEILEQEAFLTEPPDAVVLQQVNQDHHRHQLEYDRERSPDPIPENDNVENFEGNTAIQTDEKSDRSKYPLAPINKSSRSLQSSIRSYWSRFLNHPRVSSYRPTIARLKSRLLDYQSKFLSFIKQKRKREILWNIGLVVLAAIVVILLSR